MMIMMLVIDSDVAMQRVHPARPTPAAHARPVLGNWQVLHTVSQPTPQDIVAHHTNLWQVVKPAKFALLSSMRRRS